MFIQISSNLFEEDFIFCFTFAHKVFEKNPVFESYFSAFCISIRDRTINIHYFLVIFAYFINILIKIISSIYSQVNNMKYPLKIHGTFSLSILSNSRKNIEKVAENLCFYRIITIPPKVTENWIYIYTH